MSDEFNNGTDPQAASNDAGQSADLWHSTQAPKMSAETLQAAKKVLGRLAGDGHRQGSLDARS